MPCRHCLCCIFSYAYFLMMCIKHFCHLNLIACLYRTCSSTVRQVCAGRLHYGRHLSALYVSGRLLYTGVTCGSSLFQVVCRASEDILLVASRVKGIMLITMHFLSAASNSSRSDLTLTPSLPVDRQEVAARLMSCSLSQATCANAE